jgi:hypothetical protein
MVCEGSGMLHQNAFSKLPWLYPSGSFTVQRTFKQLETVSFGATATAMITAGHLFKKCKIDNMQVFRYCDHIYFPSDRDVLGAT